MPESGSPTTPPETGGQGTQPGASGNAANLISSQGPNDPLNPPATGGGQQPATGSAGDGQEPQESNAKEALARMAEQRDAARRELEELKRSALPPEEQERLKALDAKDKERDAREKSLILRYEIASRAPKLGIVDPEVAVLLLERSNKVEVDGEGTVVGLDEALRDLIKEKPHLVRATTASIDAGAGSTGARTGGKVSMNDVIRGAARGRAITTK